MEWPQHRSSSRHQGSSSGLKHSDSTEWQHGSVRHKSREKVSGSPGPKLSDHQDWHYQQGDCNVRHREKTSGHQRPHDQVVSKRSESIPSYWRSDAIDDDLEDTGAWRNIMQMVIQQRSQLANQESSNSGQSYEGQGHWKYSDIQKQYHQSRGIPLKETGNSGRRSADKEIGQGHHRRNRRSSGSSRASSSRESTDGEKKDKDKDVVTMERKLHDLQRELAEERQMSRREKITIARLQQELSRSKSKTVMRDGLMKELDRERMMRSDAERRLHEMTIESDACKRRLQNLQDDFTKMDDMVRNMVQYKSKVEQLKQDKAGMSCSYENNLQKYRTHINDLEHENLCLLHKVKKMEAQQSACFFCKQDLDYRVRQTATLTQESDKSKLLLERLKKLEAENSALVLENENQRTQYEKCLDEIANQVVQALLTQKSLREECMKLQTRVKDLEQQNRQLNIMFQQRMRYASDSFLQSYPGAKRLTRNKMNGSTDSKVSGSQDSYHSLPVQTKTSGYPYSLPQPLHSSGNSLHSMDSSEFYLSAQDSLYNSAAQPQPSDPPAWLRDKLHNKIGIVSPESPDSLDGPAREGQALESPSGSQPGSLTPRSKIKYLLRTQLNRQSSPTVSVTSSVSRIETEFPATNSSPKMKRVEYISKGRHSRQASTGSLVSESERKYISHGNSIDGMESQRSDFRNDVGVYAGNNSRHSPKNRATEKDSYDMPSEMQRIKADEKNGQSCNPQIAGSEKTKIEGPQSGRYRYVEEFYDLDREFENKSQGELKMIDQENLVLSKSSNSYEYPDVSPGRELLKLSDAFEEKYTANKDGLPEIEPSVKATVSGDEMSPHSKHLSIASSVSLNELLEGELEACDTEDEIADDNFDERKLTKFDNCVTEMEQSTESIGSKLESSDTESVQTMKEVTANASACDLSSSSGTIHSREVSIDREMSSSPRPTSLKITPIEIPRQDVKIGASTYKKDIKYVDCSIISPVKTKSPPPVPEKPKIKWPTVTPTLNNWNSVNSGSNNQDKCQSNKSSYMEDGHQNIKGIKAFFENNDDRKSQNRHLASSRNLTDKQSDKTEAKTDLVQYQSVVGFCYQENIKLTDPRIQEKLTSYYKTDLDLDDENCEFTTLCPKSKGDVYDYGVFMGSLDRQRNKYGSKTDRSKCEHDRNPKTLTVEIKSCANGKEQHSIVTDRSFSDSGVECNSPLGSSSGSSGNMSRNSPQITEHYQEDGNNMTVKQQLILDKDKSHRAKNGYLDSSEDEEDSHVNFIEMWKSRPSRPLKLPEWNPKQTVEDVKKNSSTTKKIDFKKMDELLQQINENPSRQNRSASECGSPTLSSYSYNNKSNTLPARIDESTNRKCAESDMMVKVGLKTSLDEFDKEWEELCKKAKVVCLSNDPDIAENSVGQVSPRSDLTPTEVDTKFRQEFYSLCRIESNKSLLSGASIASSEPNLKLITPDSSKSFTKSLSCENLIIGSKVDEDYEDFDEITKQIAILSKTVEELKQSVTSLHSDTKSEDIGSAASGSSSINEECSLAGSDLSNKYHWIDDLETSNTPAVQQNREPDWLISAAESQSCSGVTQKRDRVFKKDQVKSKANQNDVEVEYAERNGHIEPDLSNPLVRADLLDSMLSKACDVTDVRGECIPMLRKRKGDVVKQAVIMRPALDARNLFIRFGKQEKEAVAKFDFLQEIHCSELDSTDELSFDDKPCLQTARSGEENFEYCMDSPVETGLRMMKCTELIDQNKKMLSKDESMEFVSESGSFSDLSDLNVLEQNKLFSEDFTEEILKSLDKKCDLRILESNGFDFENRLSQSTAGSSAPYHDADDGLSFSDSCCEEFSSDEDE